MEKSNYYQDCDFNLINEILCESNISAIVQFEKTENSELNLFDDWLNLFYRLPFEISQEVHFVERFTTNHYNLIFSTINFVIESLC